MTGRRAIVCWSFVAALVVAAAARAEAGSTEPSLAIGAVSASTVEGAVSLVVTANYDHMNVVRLGYPVTVVLTAGATVARLGLDGSVTVAGAPVPGAPGVIAIAPEQLTVVVPPALVPAGAATVQLEAVYEGTTLRSNVLGVTW